MYDIRGKGEKREVYDGDRLVGRIVRHSYIFEEIIHSRTGVRYSKSTRIGWWAEMPDGTPLHRKGAVRRMTQDTMKAWRDPKAWVL